MRDQVAKCTNCLSSLSQWQGLEHGCERMREVEERRRERSHFRVQGIRRVILMDAEVTQNDGQTRSRKDCKSGAKQLMIISGNEQRKKMA